jgi:two-component system chemotaxis sensor kinase CheA
VAVIREKALQKGVITADQAQRMGEREILNLVFAAGFSTAAKITKVSGRGVGMDVVKTHIEKIGGSIDLQSEVGRGTRIRIKIPLTLAIIPALIVSVGSEKFAIPQVNLLELVRLEESISQTSIEWIHGSPVYRLRGKLLPLIYLDKLLAAEGSEEGSAEKVDGALNIVVLQADDRMFGLVVEEVHDTQEIVVKPLSELLKGTNCYAGATIMGDGNVALILDVVGLVQLGCVVNETRSQAISANERQTGTGVERQSLLLFRSGTRRLAVPLALVGRLEEFPHSEVEHAGDRNVVQYREQILALIPLAQQLGLSPAAESGEDEPVQVIVFSEGTRRVGLVVEEILDIVDEAVTIRNHHEQPGILGSAVVGGLVTDFIDFHYLIHNLEQEWFSGTAANTETGGRILIDDGSHFSRNLVRNYLEMAGYQVLEAANSQEAIDRLQRERVDVLLSRLDLPGEGPFELLRRVRVEPEWRALPAVGLASSPEEMEQRGEREFEVDDYQMRFDKDATLSSISRLAAVGREQQLAEQRK